MTEHYTYSAELPSWESKSAEQILGDIEEAARIIRESNTPTKIELGGEAIRQLLEHRRVKAAPRVEIPGAGLIPAVVGTPIHEATDIGPYGYRITYLNGKIEEGDLRNESIHRGISARSIVGFGVFPGTVRPGSGGTSSWR